jgi:hypothetical protein
MFPAQALAETLKSKGWDIAMMTDGRGRKHAGNIPADPIIDVKAASISPRRPIAAIAGSMQLAKGVRQAKAFIKDWQPNVVVGFGGYPAFPALRAAHNRNRFGSRLDQFGIIRLNRGGHDNRSRAVNLPFFLADKDFCAALFEPLCIGALAHIATLHSIAEIEQNLGNARHANPANADKMDRANIKWHLRGLHFLKVCFGQVLSLPR